MIDLNGFNLGLCQSILHFIKLQRTSEENQVIVVVEKKTLVAAHRRGIRMSFMFLGDLYNCMM